MGTRRPADTKRIRLTEKFIKGLAPPERGSYIAYDGELPGFGVRVTAHGARSFVLNYYFQGRERRMTIGKWPRWNATGAREEAKKLGRQIDQGLDPLADKQERRAAPTFKEIASEYLRRHATTKKTGAEDKRYLERDVLPEWGSRKAVDIRKADVIALVEAKAQAAPAAANALLMLLKGVFNWAIRVDLLQANPAASVRPPSKQSSRDRTLSEKEIRILWHGLDGAAMSPEVRAALRLILVTCQRPGEVAGLEWAEVSDGLWTIPSSRHKAGRGHVVPLSSLALEILGSMPRSGPHVFPSPTRMGRPIQRMALSTALYLNRERIGLAEPVKPHDLRRTAATLLPADRFVKRLILGHSDRETTSIYDRQAYLVEKRTALEAWAAKLREIISVCERV